MPGWPEFPLPWPPSHCEFPAVDTWNYTSYHTEIVISTYYDRLRYAPSVTAAVDSSDLCAQQLEKAVTRLGGDIEFNIAAEVANEQTIDAGSSADYPHTVTGTLVLNVYNHCVRGTITTDLVVGEIVGRCEASSEGASSITCPVKVASRPVKELQSRLTVFNLSSESAQMHFIDTETGPIAIVDFEKGSLPGMEQLAGTCTWR